jgi:hypothetical protein
MATTSPNIIVPHVVVAGGVPDHTDVVLSGIFIVLFFSIGVYFHFRTFHAYGKKFIWSGLCFSYSIARIVALSLRIAVVQVSTIPSHSVEFTLITSTGSNEQGSEHCRSDFDRRWGCSSGRCLFSSPNCFEADSLQVYCQSSTVSTFLRPAAPSACCFCKAFHHWCNRFRRSSPRNG